MHLYRAFNTLNQACNYKLYAKPFSTTSMNQLKEQV